MNSPDDRELSDDGRDLNKVSAPIPRTAAWLGAAGVLPFITAAIVGAWDLGSFGAQAKFAAVIYGAVILSFLGGVFWGIAVASRSPVIGDGERTGLFVVGVMPSLAGWGAALLPVTVAPFALSALFLIILFADHWAWRREWTPSWWLRLRVRLSGTVATVLAIIGFFA
jgi:hypothetical protein